jgi:hypothetical protein
VNILGVVISIGIALAAAWSVWVIRRDTDQLLADVARLNNRHRKEDTMPEPPPDPTTTQPIPVPGEPTEPSDLALQVQSALLRPTPEPREPGTVQRQYGDRVFTFRAEGP